MSNVILAIKKSQSTSEPTSLANGELAYSYSSNKLFIGQTDNQQDPVSVEYIGGKLLVDKVANLESIISSDSTVQTFSSVTATTRATVEELVFNNFTENGVLYTDTDGRVVGVSGNSGQVMQVSDDGRPVFGDLNGGEFSQVTDNIIPQSEQSDDRIIELEKTISALRTKIVMLTEAIIGERELTENIPLPHTIISQIVDLERNILYKDKLIDYYEKALLELDESVVINKDKIIMPRRTSAFKK